MRFTLEIDCSGEAFQPPEPDPTEESRLFWTVAELRHVLAKVARNAPIHTGVNVRRGHALDAEGRRVGSWSLSDMDGEDTGETPKRETLDEMLDRHQSELTARGYRKALTASDAIYALDSKLDALRGAVSRYSCEGGRENMAKVVDAARDLLGMGE